MRIISKRRLSGKVIVFQMVDLHSKLIFSIEFGHDSCTLSLESTDLRNNHCETNWWSDWKLELICQWSGQIGHFQIHNRKMVTWPIIFIRKWIIKWLIISSLILRFYSTFLRSCRSLTTIIIMCPLRLKVMIIFTDRFPYPSLF